MLSHICCPAGIRAFIRPAVVAKAWQRTGPRHRGLHRSDPSCRSTCGAVRTQAAAAAAKHTTKSMAVVEDTKLVPLELIFGNARYRAPQVTLYGGRLRFGTLLLGRRNVVLEPEDLSVPPCWRICSVFDPIVKLEVTQTQGKACAVLAIQAL